jgi:hypothetical protein
MQFRHASLKEWAARYEHLKKAGITPYQSFNHGPSMSCYYEDPDGNLAEISGPNYLTDAEYRDFFASPGFARKWYAKSLPSLLLNLRGLWSGPSAD